MSATLLPLSKFLRQIPDPRKKRVVGHPAGSPAGCGLYRHDVRLSHLWCYSGGGRNYHPAYCRLWPLPGRRRLPADVGLAKLYRGDVARPDPEVDCLDEDGEAHSEVDVALGNVEAGAIGD